MSNESNESQTETKAKSKVESTPESSASSLPFEPNSKKKAEKRTKPTPAPRRAPANAGIPEEVTQRMVRRMAFFSGIPSLLGMATFIASYIAVTQLHYNLPNSAVLLVSLGFFGLGVLGLSYGILSASWEPEQSGSLIGAEEFGINFSRMQAAWKDARKQAMNQPKK